MTKRDRIKISKSDLMNHLQEQVYFLIESCKKFDEGEYREGKRIAHSLRVLLHDTRQSKSLLGQLGTKDNRFFNTCSPKEPENLAPYVPLLSFSFNGTLGCRPWIIPLGTPTIWPKNNKIRFSDWWNAIVITTPKKYTKTVSFCRRDIVLHVSNTDGGSHIDPTLEKKYALLSKWNALGIVTEQDGIEKPIGNPVLPCIRQIAHELLLLLQEKYPTVFPVEYEMQISASTPPDWVERSDSKSDVSLGFPDILK